ncbi:MAG TPA: Gfo/Idh/MocA family oxidoreductase [Opitutaceae bacterium]|jgi:predicted dehydrogenase|nr:Gfo/Idh/MocA family oxidoreductase [Opitutaceae bacterium]
MLRFGLIGLGNIGKVHTGNFSSGKIPRGKLTAVSDIAPPKFELPPGVKYFPEAEAMMDAGLVDAVIVATPHPLHRALGEKVLKRGLHLLMEKPLTATKLDGELLLAAPRQPGQQFGLMMNLRTHPQYRRIKEVLDSGGLGSFQRMQWTITNWFRPEAYYTMSNWRATWKGEGGGVLINQALHNLDVLQWLCGMPVAVRAFCKFGQDHDIEVEDSVIAYLEFANGATGVFTTKTGEAPGVNRLEIAGSGGLMVLENEHLVVTKNKVDIREYSRTTDNAFGVPEKTIEEFPNRDEYPSHAGVINNFVEAVLDGKPLIAEAAEGLKSVELANAMVYSTWKDTRVVFPLDAAAYQASLDQVIATSKPRHRQIKEAKVDMKKSYS